VRMRGGFFENDANSFAKQKSTQENSSGGSTAEKTSNTQLQAAIASTFPERGLPVSLSLAYVNSSEKGLTLTVAVQVNSHQLFFNSDETKQKADVDIRGFIYNAEGKVGASFDKRMTITRPGTTRTEGAGRDLVYSYPVTIGPGLYQVRVAVRDETTGSVGSAQDWIEIPDVSKSRLAISSLIVSERTPGSQITLAGSTADNGSTLLDQANISVDHRFHLNSFLRFFAFIYSDVKVNAKPDVVVQVQILRDNQPIVTTSLRKVPTEGIPDLTRLVYAAEISLEHLSAGRYILQLTAIDRQSQVSATQRMRFMIQ